MKSGQVDLDEVGRVSFGSLLHSIMIDSFVNINYFYIF